MALTDTVEPPESEVGTPLSSTAPAALPADTAQPSIIPGWGENTLAGIDLPRTSISAPAADAPASTLPSVLEPYSSERVQGLQADLAGVARERGAAMERSQGVFESMLSRDRQRLDEAWTATRAAADRIPPPWDADKEREARIRGPIENFGSIASVFGVIASAFTRTPLTSALNASAAAMTAIRNSDEEGYQAAYGAWKENTNLAIKRFEMERQVFADTNKLIDTDLSLWRARTLADAARFDNKKAIMLLEAGMDKEILDMQHAGIRAASDLVKVREEWETYDIRRSLYSNMVKAWDEANPDAEPQQRALARLQITESLSQQGGNSWQINVLRNARMSALAQGKILTAEEEADLIKRIQTYGRGTNNPQWQFIQRRTDELVGEGMPITDAMRQAESEWKESSTAPAKAGSEADFISRRSKELVAEGMSKTDADKQAAREWKEARQAPVRQGTQTAFMQERVPEIMAQEGKSKTEAEKQALSEWEKSRAQGRTSVLPATRIDDLRSLHDRAGTMVQTIDKVEALLAKHKALTGVGGSITRPMEVASNWFGSNETDRAQFRRYISELQEWGTRVLNESKGRPLSAEVSKLNNIIPGLAPGDTTTNVVRAYRELKPLLGQIQQQLRSRMEGTWTPDTSKPGNGKGGETPMWQRAPVTGPRSSIEDEGRIVSDEMDDGVEAGQRYARARRLPPDATAIAVERARNPADRTGRGDLGADPLDALPSQTMPPNQRVRRGFDALSGQEQSMGLDPMPNLPSPPFVPKEWPPHPLNPTRLAGDVVPLPVAPNPNAGPASLEQSLDPTGQGVIKIPREKLREFLRRRSWAELQQYLDEQTG